MGAGRLAIAKLTKRNIYANTARKSKKRDKKYEYLRFCYDKLIFEWLHKSLRFEIKESGFGLLSVTLTQVNEREV